MNSPVISVIVPVYKAENYLHRCVDSILAQTFTDFEVLLVDDGSPDRSGEICDEYAQKDGRVRVFHKENGGVSSARNVGIDNALGKYTIHADPDDWVEPNMLEELYKKAQEEDADMVICDFYIHTKNKEIYISQKPSETSNNVLLDDIMNQRVHGGCWNKLIKASSYRGKLIRFPENMIIWEDQFYICNILLISPLKINHIAIPLYHYDIAINTDSLVYRNKNIKQMIMSQEYFISYFSNILESRVQLLNHFKIVTKNKAFITAYKKKDIIDYYSEINSYYSLLSKNLLCPFVALTIKFPCFYKIFYIAYHILNKIKIWFHLRYQ